MRGCCVVQVVSEEDNTNLLFKPGSLEHWTPDPGNTEALERAKCTVVRDVDGLYGPLSYRTAARTLFLRPYLAHFCSFFRHFFAVFSVLTPGIRKVAPKDRGSVPQRSKMAEERVVAADQFLMDRYSARMPAGTFTDAGGNPNTISTACSVVTGSYAASACIHDEPYVVTSDVTAPASPSPPATTTG